MPQTRAQLLANWAASLAAINATPWTNTRGQVSGVAMQALLDALNNNTVALINSIPVLYGDPTVTINWVQTVVTLSANTSAPLIAANSNRTGLRWQVTGSNPMTVVPGPGPAVVNAGFNYQGNSGSGSQGASDDFSGEVPSSAFTAISTLGTTITVWEGQ